MMSYRAAIDPVVKIMCGVAVGFILFALWQPPVGDYVITKIVLGVIVLAIYLNIGWAFGTYFNKNIYNKIQKSFCQALWGGGFNLWNSHSQEPNPLIFDQILFSLIWPIYLGIVLGSWVVYLIYQLGRLIKALLWFIFAGGIAKKLGIG